VKAATPSIYRRESRAAAGVTRASQIPGSCRTPAYIRLLSAELEYPGQFPAGDVLVGYASTQLPQFPLTPPEADAFVSGKASGTCCATQGMVGGGVCIDASAAVAAQTVGS
jgi:hypothetical protein